MEPTLNLLHTKKRGKRGKTEGVGVGVGGAGMWGRGSTKSPLPLTVSWWTDGGGVSLSLLCLFSAGETATQPVVAPKGEGPGLLHGGWGGDRWPAPATEIVALLPYTTPWEMLLRSVESGVVDGTGCGGGKRWCCYNTRRVGRAMGTATHPCKALDSPQA